jgi:hypothetical protein
MGERHRIGLREVRKLAPGQIVLDSAVPRSAPGGKRARRSITSCSIARARADSAGSRSGATEHPGLQIWPERKPNAFLAGS